MVLKLDGVHDEDKPVVSNVVAAIEALKAEKILMSWTIEHQRGYYTISVLVSDTADCEFSKSELDVIHEVSPLRVVSVSIARVSGKMRLRVRVSDKDEPIMLTETQVLTVRKRARWAME